MRILKNSMSHLAFDRFGSIFYRFSILLLLFDLLMVLDLFIALDLFDLF